MKNFLTSATLLLFIVESFINVEHFYVAEFAKKKEICGFVIFGIFSIKTAHLMILAVHPKYQRHGIGTKLLERVIEVVAFTPINTIRLEVRTTNKIAIEFYEKYDFTIATTIEKYYDNVDGDAFLMVRKIE